MLLNFTKQYDGDDVISENDYALGIPSSVVEEASCTAFNVCESSGLYYLAGWAVFGELKTLACNACIETIRVRHVSSGQISESLYTCLKSYDCKDNFENTVSVNTYSTNFLCHPSRNVLQLLNNAEVVFRSNSLKMMNIHNPSDFLVLGKFAVNKFAVGKLASGIFAAVKFGTPSIYPAPCTLPSTVHCPVHLHTGLLLRCTLPFAY